MDATLKVVGEIAGIAGIALVVAMYVFRDIIRKTALKNLPPGLAYRLMRLIVGAAWSLAVIGILIRFAPTVLAIQTGDYSHQTIGKEASK